MFGGFKLYFSSNLLYLTKTTDINQNQLALKLHINRQQITKYLKGQEPNYQRLIDICSIYKITIDDMLKKDLSKESENL